MTAISTALGIVLVAAAVRDVFDTLFHPHGRGVISEALMGAIWRLTRLTARGNHTMLSLAGPVAFITVIAAWGTMVAVGFALIIWPQLPEGFAIGAGLDATAQDGYVDALYLSLVDLTSLGYGDIVPTSDILRLLGPLETLIGLGLLTASISWILSLYRVLSDYRSLSHEIALLIEAERTSPAGLIGIDPSVSARVLADLTSRVVTMRDDIAYSPISYYFHPRDSRHALPVLLPRLLEVVESCSAPERAPALRFGAAMLGLAIEDLLATIAERFLGPTVHGAHDALAHYRRDHLWAAH